MIIAHRVNEDDLPGHLLEQGGWDHLQLPLIAMRRRSYKLPGGGSGSGKRASCCGRTPSANVTSSCCKPRGGQG